MLCVLKNALKKLGKCLSASKEMVSVMAISLLALLMPIPVYASTIGSSRIAMGTQNLITDTTTWLLIVSPTITIVAVGYYFIRKAVSDEMDHRKWSTRITTAIFSCVGVMTASVIIRVILSYY